MIRKFQEKDIDRVAEIWLNGNLEAHFFIAEEYWKDHFDMVKEMLASAEIYVLEDEKGIQGFVGLNGHHIEGIFVDGTERPICSLKGDRLVFSPEGRYDNRKSCRCDQRNDRRTEGI